MAALGYALEISIHASREGCDQGEKAGSIGYAEISIHASREGCDCGGYKTALRAGYFYPRIP